MKSAEPGLLLNGRSGIVLIITISVCLFITLLAAEPRGMTNRELDPGATAEGQLLPCAPFVHTETPAGGQNLLRDEWIAIDSLQLNTILDADKSIGLLWSDGNQDIELSTNIGQLAAAAKQAVQKAPLWIQPELANVFSQLETADQQNWAAIINNAVDPYVDEIAFSVATSSPVWLSSIYANPQMLVENAQQIYLADSQLSYVNINNYGSSVAGGDYYSTTSYYKINADSELVQVEVPRDIYYWYIVHPKITDEIPAYIDPVIVESNTTHANNIADPPLGQFWRTFFYNVQEGVYPCLADTLMQLNSVYNRVGPANDVIHAIQWWINNTMGFTSNSERPHQPVRIYRKHIGRCGEYGDYTQAAARAALIPCTQILSISTDHVWNEFWEDGWVQWEPVNGYINIPLVYENGWSKVFGSVFENRSDGCLSAVTERYSEGIATINIAVSDSLDRPVDGARVILAINESGIRVDMVDFTDNQGLVSFPVGENRHYYVRTTSPVGYYPPNAGTYVSIIDNSVTGEVYNFTLEIPDAFAAPDITEIPPPTDTAMDWRIGVSFAVPHQVIRGVVAWDDIDITGTVPYFYNELDAPGSVNLLMTDADNFIFYEVANACGAFNVLENVQNGSAMFNIPAGQDWYVFLDNSGHASNAQHVTSGMVYYFFGVGNEDETQSTPVLSLLTNYPNPFKTSTDIRFSLKDDSKVKICIYNLKGRKVIELLNNPRKAGINTVNWDGTDYNSSPVGSGVYYYTVSAEGRTLSRKLLLLR